MGPESADDPGDAPDNPFLRLRSRTLIPWAIVGSVAGGVFLVIVSSVTPMDPDSAIVEFVFALAFYGLLAAWIAWACRRAGIDLRRLVGRVPVGYNWLPALGLLVTTMVFSTGSWFVTAYGLSHLAPGLLEALVTLGETIVDSIAVAVAWAILAVVIGPVTEEVLFRGMLVSRWGTKWGIGTGIVVSAVIFGVLHPVDAAGATAFGFVAALLYLQSRTLIVPIAVHAANNLVATVTEDLFAWGEPWTLAAEVEEIEAMALPGLAMVVVTLPVIIWYVRRHWPSRDAEIPYMKGG
ncbi:MAG: type II CAAX endopeptidase family protein [Gemmatimonadetes bacterium]|nr:type II CAAX endopeptidase family protein [Gemmatimonadota bacterium]